MKKAIFILFFVLSVCFALNAGANFKSDSADSGHEIKLYSFTFHLDSSLNATLKFWSTASALLTDMQTKAEEVARDSRSAIEGKYETESLLGPFEFIKFKNRVQFYRQVLEYKTGGEAYKAFIATNRDGVLSRDWVREFDYRVRSDGSTLEFKDWLRDQGLLVGYLEFVKKQEAELARQAQLLAPRQQAAHQQMEQIRSRLAQRPENKKAQVVAGSDYLKVNVKSWVEMQKSPGQRLVTGESERVSQSTRRTPAPSLNDFDRHFEIEGLERITESEEKMLQELFRESKKVRGGLNPCVELLDE